MSLAITVFENVKLVDSYTVCEHDIYDVIFPENAIHVRKCEYGQFRQFGDLVDDGVYTYDNSFSLVRIPYSTWSKYRNVMCMKMDLQPTKCDDPYVNTRMSYIKTMIDMCSDDNYAVFDHSREHVLLSDLIIHSDFDGFISTEYCKVIYNDLLEYERLYYDTNVNDGYNIIHDNLKRTFGVASRTNGIVQFS